jgi:hypothetical protein
MFYELGVKAAADTYAPVKPPAAPKPTAASELSKETGVSAQKATLQSPTAPKVQTPSLPPPPAAPKFKPPDIGAKFKLGSFNAGMSPKDKLRPGEIDPNNKDREVGTNFDDPRPDNRIGAAFDSFRTVKNHDVLNDLGEATIGSPVS